jgi:phosphoribosylformylglycinamidine synthase PurS subunit
MQFKASVVVMPQKEILDPQGKAVEGALNQLVGSAIENVRIGKKIEFVIHADTKEKATAEVEEVSKKLLANLIMEDFHIEIETLEKN